MDFSFIFDANCHPMDRLLGNHDSSTPKVKGMVHNVQQFVSFLKAPCYSKVAGALYAYLILQGYDKEQLALLTITPQQADIFGFLPNNYKITAEDVIPFEDFQLEQLEKAVQVCIIVLGNVHDPIQINISHRFAAFLEKVVLHVRSGLYLIGNPSGFSAVPKLQKYFSWLQKHHRVSSSLLLQCPRHEEEEPVLNYKDFPILGGGFCSSLCDQELKCGHVCPRRCHFEDHNQDNQQNSSRQCFQSCGKLCPNGHPCSELCHSVCPPCSKVVFKTFSCGHRISYKCSEPVPAKCRESKRIIRGACGHDLTVLCGLNEAPKCQEIITQKLYCGHGRTIECYRKCIPCDVEVSVRRFGCAHSVKVSCHESSEEKFDEPCKEECARFCKRGHPCRRGHKCGEACPPCESNVSFMFAECHHRLTVPCYQGDSKEAQYCQESCSRRSCDHPCNLLCGKHRLKKCPPCKIVVETERSCGHNWTHPCWIDESQVPCRELVDVGKLSACKHCIEVKCFEAAQLADGEAIFFCESRCNYYLDPTQDGCGHFCTGTCQECADNSFHHMCEEKCPKILFCGHKCQSRCSSACPPCQQLCEYSCPHGRCKHLCGFPCVPCKDRCTYECPHGKCTAECGQECNKLPCKYPCPKFLKCGHTCVGFCGEPCPPLCAICQEQELLSTDFMGKTSIGETDRFILLVDCGHTFDAEAMAYLMSKPFVVGEILPKSCPICRTEIRTSFRFKSILMRSRKDMNAVKQAIYGDPTLIYQELLAVHSILNSSAPSESFLRDLREEIIRTLYSSNFLVGASSVSFREMGMLEAYSLGFVAKTFARCIALQAELARLTIPPDLTQVINQYLIRIVDFLFSVPWPLTGFEIRSVVLEWNRISDLKELCMKQAIEQHEISKRLLQQPRGKAAFHQAFNIATAIGIPYDDKARGNYARALQELEQALDCKIGISDQERLDILKAFNFSTGRWFKCPNGHIYVITECGGATEESFCNECGAKVGGENHSILPSNDLATEMDGATQPLYPTALSRSPVQ